MRKQTLIEDSSTVVVRGRYRIAGGYVKTNSDIYKQSSRLGESEDCSFGSFADLPAPLAAFGRDRKRVLDNRYTEAPRPNNLSLLGSILYSITLEPRSIS